MSKQGDVLTALVTRLKNDSNLSYVNDELILQGVRESMTVYPLIIVEPLGTTEVEYAYPKQRLNMRVAIMCYIQTHDKDKQIVGDSNIKGVMDIANDVALALDGDRTLGGNAIHLDIVEYQYEFAEYPVRNVSLVADILFEQTVGTRT